MFGISSLNIRKGRQLFPELNKSVQQYTRRNLQDTGRDVVIYKNTSSRTSEMLVMLGGIAQWLAFGFMSYVSFQTLPAVAGIPSEKNEKRNQDQIKIQRADIKYRIGFSVFCFAASTGLLTLLAFRNTRKVYAITLLQGSKGVKLSCFTPWNTPYNVVSPIIQVSATQRRNDLGYSVPLKVKGYKLNFTVEKDSGEFLHPTLFDRTVGVKRSLK